MDKTPLKLLIAEDSEDDLLLLLRALRKGNYDVTYLHIQSADELKKALVEEEWDAIISDYSMPSFTGIEALEIVRQLDYNLPFIIVSGAIGEEIAVSAMRNGAYDYMMKDNLTRLVPSLQRSLQEATLHNEQQQREREVQAIATIATALRQLDSPENMILALHDEILKLIYVTGIAFILRTDREDELQIELASGDWLPWQDQIILASESLTGTVMQTGAPYGTTDFPNENYFGRGEREVYVSCAVGIPLIAYDEIIGAIWLGRDNPFVENEVRILVAIAEIAANSLHRARVMATLEQRVQERTAELQTMNERLTELDVLKSKFVSDVSHELRTPITSLSIYIGLLEGTDNIVKRQQYIDILRKQAQRLSQLVDNILDLSRLESNPDELVFETVNINQVVSEVMTDLAPVAKNQKLKVANNLAEYLPSILGDYNKLTEVITNLMSNAINYTPEGKINVITQFDEGTHHIEIIVQDTGIGIASQDINHLFDRFYRGSTVGQLSVPGSGLGLAIVNEIVKLHHGTITVDSKEKQGSTFIVRLPVITQSSPAENPANPPANQTE